jgi:autotransporter-associated beta strand protein
VNNGGCLSGTGSINTVATTSVNVNNGGVLFPGSGAPPSTPEKLTVTSGQVQFFTGAILRCYIGPNNSYLESTHNNTPAVQLAGGHPALAIDMLDNGSTGGTSYTVINAVNGTIGNTFARPGRIPVAKCTPSVTLAATTVSVSYTANTAKTTTWTASGSLGWYDSANWSNGAPNDGDSIIINGTGNLNLNGSDLDPSVWSITFAAPTNFFYIRSNGAQRISVTNGFAVSPSGATAYTYTVDSPLNVAADQNWDIDTVGNGSALSVGAGNISGYGGIIKRSPGTLTFTGNSTAAFQGGLTINGGTVSAAGNGNVGLAGQYAAVTINTGGTLSVGNVNFAHNFQINAGGTFYVPSGTSTYTFLRPFYGIFSFTSQCSALPNLPMADGSTIRQRSSVTDSMTFKLGGAVTFDCGGFNMAWNGNNQVVGEGTLAIGNCPGGNWKGSIFIGGIGLAAGSTLNIQNGIGTLLGRTTINGNLNESTQTGYLDRKSVV